MTVVNLASKRARDRMDKAIPLAMEINTILDGEESATVIVALAVIISAALAQLEDPDKNWENFQGLVELFREAGPK